MLKKYFLNLITALIFSSSNIYAITKDNISAALQDDAVHCLSELANIASVGSKSSLQIKITSAFSLLKNLIWGSNKLYIGATNIKEVCATKKIDIGIYSLFNLYYGIQNILFGAYDGHLFLRSNQIAKINKADEIKFNNQKVKQVIWLLVNFVFPYITLAAKRTAWDNATLKYALFHKNSNTQSSALSYNLFMVCQFLSNISEHFRRSVLYKQLDRKSKIHKQSINERTNNSEESFLMPIEGVFFYPNIGTVVTGKIEKGRIQVGDEISIVGSELTKNTIVKKLHILDKEVYECKATNNIVAILFNDINQSDVQRGQILVKTDSLKFNENVKLEKKAV